MCISRQDLRVLSFGGGVEWRDERRRRGRGWLMALILFTQFMLDTSRRRSGRCYWLRPRSWWGVLSLGWWQIRTVLLSTSFFVSLVSATKSITLHTLSRADLRAMIKVHHPFKAGARMYVALWSLPHTQYESSRGFGVCLDRAFEEAVCLSYWYPRKLTKQRYQIGYAQVNYLVCWGLCKEAVIPLQFVVRITFLWHWSSKLTWASSRLG